MNINTFRSQYNSEMARIKDLGDMGASMSEVSGRVMINAAGEAYADVAFSVRFVEPPSFKSGFGLVEGADIIPGKMPTGSAYVAEWKTVERLPFSVWYVGARIHIVTTGLFYQKMTLNYSFSGKTITNPVGL